MLLKSVLQVVILFLVTAMSRLS